jgi:hypothetical protein
MSFLSRLLGKAPAHTAVNQTAVRSSEKSAEQPRQPASERPKATQSRAAEAASNLSFGEPLLQMAFEPGAHQRSAQRRLAELLDSKAIALTDLPIRPEKLPVTLNIAAQAADAAHFEQIAGYVDDPQLWVVFATTGGAAKLRQLAASRVEGADQLRAVMKAVREKDKNVYRIAKTKLDAINSAAKRAEESRAHMHSIAETIERHSYKPFDNAYIATVEHLVGEWQAVDSEIPQDLRVRVQSAIDRAGEIISEHIRAAGAQAARESAIANAQPLREASIDELKKILIALYAATAFDASSAASVEERIGKLTSRWNDTLDYQRASQTETIEFEALRGAVQRLSRHYLKHETLQQQLDKLESEPSADAYSHAYLNVDAAIVDRSLLGDSVPSVVTLAETTTAQWREQQKAIRTAADDAERSVTQLIRRAQNALAAGRSRQAVGIRRSIEPKLAQLKSIPKHVTDRLQQLDEKLNELQDWKSFAVTPKRGELIEHMQSLIDIDRDPQELADDIKRLQEEWKALAKGVTDSDEDWAKFHEAAQAAYAPCKAFFEEQSQVRERNLEQRKALVARLAVYRDTTDWDHVDWKNVVNALRSAKQEWRTSSPTDRGATKPIEKQFDELIVDVQARLDAEYTANLERKQALVTQAQKLSSVSDLSQAANDVKRLQTAWRNVGLTPQAEGQRLWEEFKQSCDAVFDKRRHEQTERMAELEQNEERALAVCIELEGLSQRTGTELYAAAARTRELRDAFSQIGELPRDKSHEIQRRFKRATEQFEHAIAQQRVREGEEAWDNLFDASNRIRLLQLNSSEGVDAALTEYIAAIAHWPKGGKSAIEQKLKTIPKTALEENAAALRELAIRAEIATGTATPDEDQSQRRSIQLQALVKGIGRTSATVESQIEALAFEWIAIGPVPDDTYDALFARFKRSWTAARR